MLCGFSFCTCIGNAHCFPMQPVELSMAIFCMFCSPRWFLFSIHTILSMFYASCKNPLFWLANIFLIAQPIYLTDYLVVLVDYFVTTWRKYLSLFSWTHVLFLDWCLEPKVTSLDFYSLDFQCYFCGCSYYLFYCILLLSFSKLVYMTILNKHID